MRYTSCRTLGQPSFLFAQKDIRYLDFAALRKAGYRGAVFDKDNCLVRYKPLIMTFAESSGQTVPYQDTLVPELQVRNYESQQKTTHSKQS